MDNYRIGQHVKFRDANATTSQGEEVVASGVVNGEPSMDGGPMLIPVWSRRDGGREPTTVFVNARNIITVTEE